MQLYINEKNLICAEQFGFRLNYSTELATLYLTDYSIKHKHNNLILMKTYLDLSKAFDTLDHIIIFKELKTMESHEQYYLCFEAN